MFTKKLKPHICSFADFAYKKTFNLAKLLVKYNVSANIVTFSGIGFAVLGLNFLAIESYSWAFLCLILNRVCDILDGMCARLNGITDFGIFFDIVADYTSFALFLWGFILANPPQNSVSGAFMMMSLLISAISLLTYTLTTKQDYNLINQSNIKICIWGHLQNFDTFIALCLMCLFNMFFTVISIFFGLLLLLKSLIIVSNAYYVLEIKNKN